MKSIRFVVAIVLSVVLVIGDSFLFGNESEAGSRGGGQFGRSFSGSSSYSKNSSWSSHTQGTWDRSGGGFFGGDTKSSSGYAKPSVGGSGSSSGYSKPLSSDQTSSGPQKPSSDINKSSSGYKKPSLSNDSSSSDSGSVPSKTSGGYQKPSVQSSSKESFTGGSKFDKETINQERKKRSQESLERYKSEQSRFMKPDYKVEGAESSPLASKARVYSGFDYNTHYNQRDNYYRAQGYQPPAFAFNTSPSFGIFNTIFLFWMLDHISNKNVAATAYNHSNDPGFQKWRQELETQAKDNAELKAKLAEMDKQIKALDGTPKDRSYLPPGVPPEAALATAVFEAKAPEKPLLKIAAGRPGGVYDKYAVMFDKAASGFGVKIIPTSGSLENLKLLTSNEADLAVVQSDLLALMDKKVSGKALTTEQSTLYVEYVQLIANRSGGVRSIKDIDSAKNVIYVGPKGSGTAMTWEALCEQDQNYGKIPVKYADYTDGLAQVETNPAALMLFVGGLYSDFLKKAEENAKKSHKLRLVAVDDSKLASKKDQQGNSIYKFVEIPANVYPNLQKGWVFGSEIKTLGVQAVLVLRNEWAVQYGTEAMDALSLAVMETKPRIQRLVNGTD
jgi:TRAP transporter TAXI family solute receptor